MDMSTDKALWMQEFERMHRSTAIEHLGITLVDISEDQIVLQMPISDKTRQIYGWLHGGMSIMLAETAASAHSAWGIDLTKVRPVGIEISGSHVRSASEGMVKAIGRVVRRSKSLIVHQVDIVEAESSRLLSTVRATNFYKPIEGEN